MGSEVTSREEIGFLETSGPRLFCCVDLPEGAAHAGVVVCPPLHAEAITSYRREVLLARALASAGLAACRFHYRGTGNSQGEPRAVTFDSMLADARAAAAHLRRRAGCELLGLVGTRYGALVAAAAVADAPVVLWDPVADPGRYFRETFRARLIHDLRRGGPGQGGLQGLLEELRRDGSVDLLGYEVTRDLYDSSLRVSLGQLLGSAGRPALVLQLSTDDELRVEYRELLAAWTGADVPVAAEIVPEDPSWWFWEETWEPEEGRPGTRALVDGSVAWLTRHLEVAGR
jgi:pimeloyl-ACP methyl ester carboxylesterase